MRTLGISALIPPELVFSCGFRPVDVNNFVPFSDHYPKAKLCAWSASWRDLIIKGDIEIDRLAVVARGDCENCVVDGERVARSGIPAFFFFYPYYDEPEGLRSELIRLRDFLGGIERPMFDRVREIKELGLKLDRMRSEGRVSSSEGFRHLISFSDLKGDMEGFRASLLDALSSGTDEVEYGSRVAVIGIPPIYRDFHEVAQGFGLHVAYDELPFEFVRLTGSDIDELARNYTGYTFAREIDHRLDFLSKEFERRKVDGIIHYTQFACHHVLEDDIFRKEFAYPVLTVQGDLPRASSEQVKLRLEAFSEMLGRR